MTWATLRILALAVVCFGAGYVVPKFEHARIEPHEPTATKIESVIRTYALSNAAVTEATIELTKTLGDVACNFEVDTENNSFAAYALPEVHERIQSLIAKLDARPAMVKINCELSRTDSEGKRTVISRPQVMTIDAMEAMISVGQADGETFEVKLLPNIVSYDAP
ncbi:MAG: hypothetical protein QM811_27545 [Pirellulales bacterium]